MDSSWLALFELLLVFGCVLGWAVWQLISLRIAKRKQRETESGRTREPDSAP